MGLKQTDPKNYSISKQANQTKLRYDLYLFDK